MMKFSEALNAINSAHEVLPQKMRSDNASALMVAIGLQESRLIYRRQIGGPARGLWQFEPIAVRDVMTRGSSKDSAIAICNDRDVKFDEKEIYNALEHDDVLAAAFARLHLWNCPKPLPAIGDIDGAWKYYAFDTWRPGKPHRKTWNAFYLEAYSHLLGGS